MTLLALPDEVLFEICHQVDPQSMISLKSDHIPLNNLSKTCRRLGCIAQKVLYRSVRPRKLGRFLRTIIARPELAAQVRCFYFDYRWLRKKPLSNGEAKKLRAKAESLNITQSMYSKIMRLREIHYGTIHEKNCYLRLLELSIALLPNITKLHIEMPVTDESDEIPHALTAVVQMKYVKHIWFGAGQLFDLESTKNFFAMMPCLEKLGIQNCGRVTEPLSFSGIRTLSIAESCISKTSLQTLINSCPELESFQYLNWTKFHAGMGDEPHFTWGQAQSILQSRRTTLKKIDIDFERPCYSTGHPLALDDYYDSFKAFDRLERLSIRTTLFGTKDEDGEGLIPKFPADVQDLVAKLPGSLTSITFFGSHKDWNGIMVLAEAIKQGYFPRLKEVLVEQEEEESERSRKLLAACGVYYEEIIRDPLYCSTCDIDTTIIYVTDNEESDSDNNEEIDSNTDEESDN